MEIRGEGARRGRVVAVVAMVTAVACGCQAILGMGGDDAHLAATATTTTDAGKDAGVAANPCVLPAAGDATLRVGNLVPSAARVDVCLSRAGAASPIDGKPVLASSSGSCPSGLGYKDVVAPFAVESGTYTLTLVSAGSACSAAAIASASVSLETMSSTGVYLLGDGLTAPTTLTLLESTPLQEETDLRFVNGIADGGALAFGLTTDPKLPATLQTVVFPSVPFGQAGQGTTSGLGPIDANGYMQISIPGGSLPFGVAPAGSTAATLDDPLVLAASESFTAFAIGRVADPTFPQELYVCDEMQAEPSEPLTRCAGGLTDVAVDAYDAYLWGPFAPFELLRAGAAPAILATTPADVLCLTDVYGTDLVDAIVDAGSATFPYHAYFDDSLATPIDDPTLADGGLPSPPTAPPCTGYEGELDSFLSCVSTYCTSPVGEDDAGVMEDPTPCISTNCTAAAEALVLDTPVQELACWSCAIFNLEGAQTVGETRSACTTNVTAGYAFNGQTGTLVLSRYPITNAEQWVLPSTDWRSSIVRAPLTVGAHELDAYCLLLSDTLSSVTTPYVGAYGSGQTGLAGWTAELDLQAQKLVAYVARKSAGVPAVVGGELYAGPAAPDDTVAANPAAYATLTSAFAFAAPPTGPPGCAFCATNPITSPPGSTPTGQSTLGQGLLLWNVPVTDVLSASFDLQASVLDAGLSDAGPYAIPLSTYYAYHSHIRLRP